MKKKPAGDESEIPSSNLRRRAEETLAARPLDTHQTLPGDAERLVHELQVHQIELEMQNEELRRAQAELEVSRERYFDLYDMAPVGYFTLSEKGLIQEVNLTAAALLGVGRKALIHQPLTRFILPEDQDIYYRHRKQLFETPSTDSISSASSGQAGARQVCEFRMLREGAEPFWARVEASVARDAAGLPVCRAVMSDISERKINHLAVRRSEALLNASQSLARIGGWEWDVTNGIMLWTDETYRIHDLEPGSIEKGSDAHIARSVECYDEADRPAVLAAFRACIERGEPYDLEWPFTTFKGRRRWVRTSARAVMKEGKVDRVVGLIMDITESKKAGEELTRSKALLRDVLDLVPAYICAKNREGRFLLVNRRLADFYGKPIDKITGMLHADLCEDEEELRAMLAADRQVMESGKPKVIPEETMRNPDGSTTVLETYKIPFTASDEPAVLIAAADITERKKAETRLRESEKKYHSLTEATPDNIWQLGLDLRFIYVNSAIQKMLGYAPEELVGRSIEGFFTADRLRQVQEIMDRELRNIESHTGVVFETEMIHKTGRTVPLEIHGMVLRDEKGNPTGFQGVTRDITERMKAGEAVRREQAFSEAIIDSIPGPFYVLDERGGYVKWNAYQRDEIVGKPEGETAGFSAIDTIYPDDREEVGARIANVLKNGTVEIVEGRVLLRGGPAFRWFLMTGRRMVVDGKAFLVGIGIDITDRKKAEEALSESEARFRGYIEHSPYGVFVTDGQGRYVDVNPAAARITGYSAGQLTSMSISDLLVPDSRAAGLAHFQRLVETGEAFAETAFRRADGSVGYWAVSGTRLGPDRYLGFVEDITGRKESEARILLLGRILDHAPAAITIHDTHGRFLFSNRQNVLLHGCASEEEFLSINLHDLDLPESEALLAERFQKIAEKGEARFEVMHYRKDGSAFPLDVTASAIEWRGQPAVLSIAMDITERKRAEEEVQASRELLQAVLNSIPVRVFWKDKNLRYLGCNTPFARDAGFEKPEDLLGKDDFAMGWREQAELYRADDRAVIESGEAKLLFEEVQTTPSGERIHLLTSKLPLRDAGGAVVGVLGTYYDISKLRHVEEELHHVLSSARCILWHAVVTLPAGGGKLDWSIRISNEAAAAEMLPLAREPGQTYSDVWHRGTPQEDLDRMDLVSERALREGKPGYTQEFRCRTMNGEVRWLLEDARIEELGPDRWIVVGVCTDVTARREAEEKTKQQLHELRRWHEVTLGREERIAELKREVNELAARAGEKPKYGGGGRGK